MKNKAGLILAGSVGSATNTIVLAYLFANVYQGRYQC